MSTSKSSFNNVRNWSQWLIVAVAATVFVCGLLWQSASLLGCGAAVLCIVLRQFGASAPVQQSNRRGERKEPRVANDNSPSEQPPVLDQLQASASPHSTDALV